MVLRSTPSSRSHPREFHALWTMRDSCADYVRSLDHVIGCDISVPMHRMAAFLQAGQTALGAIDPSTEFIVFGHLGDGNLHYVIRTPKRAEAADKVYRLVADHGGSISAEHASASTRSRGCNSAAVRPRSRRCAG
jgi:FAD/FMN-containing dehydrogenase